MVLTVSDVLRVLLTLHTVSPRMLRSRFVAEHVMVLCQSIRGMLSIGAPTLSMEQFSSRSVMKLKGVHWSNAEHRCELAGWMLAAG